MSTAHLDEELLQQIAMATTSNLPAAMEHYESCGECRQAVKEYSFVLQRVANEQRPVIPVETKQFIMENLPLRRRHSLSLIIGCILFFFVIIWLLVHDYRKDLPLVASAGVLGVISIIVFYESISLYNEYRRKMEAIINS